jgi:hypothetical protein
MPMLSQSTTIAAKAKKKKRKLSERHVCMWHF